jgi:hypothetical protein
MLSSLTKFILFNIILLFSFLMLILFYGRFILINESFYTYNLNRDNTYLDLTNAIKFTAQKYILNHYSTSSDYEKLTALEKQEVENQIENQTSFINKDNVANFLSKNLKNILGYLNGRMGDLYLYFPINNWGLPEETQNQIPNFLKDSNINVRELLKSQGLDTPNNLKILGYLKYSSYYLLSAILVCVVMEIFLITLYAIISKKGERYEAVGKLKTFLGVFTLIISWIFFTAQNVFIQRLIIQNGQSGNLTLILLPIFVKPLIITFSVYGLLELISGIILYNVGNRKQLVSKAHFM